MEQNLNNFNGVNGASSVNVSTPNTIQPMQAGNTTEPETDGEEISSNFTIPEELRQRVTAKAKELKEKHALRKVFAIVVAGEDDTEKPYYVAYLRRPNLMAFSQYMNFVQKDMTQANKNLAQNIFLDGDRELLEDDELFLYGLMQHLAKIIDTRSGALVKV